jgi:hypothetical protein
MDVENQGHTLSRLIANWIRQQSFDLFSVFRFPCNDFGAADWWGFHIGIHACDLYRGEIRR